MLSINLLPALATIENKMQQATEALSTAETEVRKHEEDIATINLPDMRSKCEAAKELLRNIATAKERIETLAESKQQRELQHRNLAAQLAAIDDKKKKLAEMAAPIHDANLKMTICKENLDQQKDTIHKFARPYVRNCISATSVLFVASKSSLNYPTKKPLLRLSLACNIRIMRQRRATNS